MEQGLTEATLKERLSPRRGPVFPLPPPSTPFEALVTSAAVATASAPPSVWCCFDNGRVAVLDTDGSLQHELEPPGAADFVTCLAAEHCHVWAGTSYGHVRVYSQRQRKLLHETRQHTAAVRTIHVCGTRVLSGGGDGKVVQWSVRTYTPVAQYTEYQGPVLHVATVSGSSSLFSSGDDRSVRCWQLCAEDVPPKPPKHARSSVTPPPVAREAVVQTGTASYAPLPPATVAGLTGAAKATRRGSNAEREAAKGARRISVGSVRSKATPPHAMQRRQARESTTVRGERWVARVHAGPVTGLVASGCLFSSSLDGTVKVLSRATGVVLHVVHSAMPPVVAMACNDHRGDELWVVGMNGVVSVYDTEALLLVDEIVNPADGYPRWVGAVEAHRLDSIWILRADGSAAALQCGDFACGNAAAVGGEVTPQHDAFDVKRHLHSATDLLRLGSAVAAVIARVKRYAATMRREHAQASEEAKACERKRASGVATALVAYRAHELVLWIFGQWRQRSVATRQQRIDGMLDAVAERWAKRARLQRGDIVRVMARLHGQGKAALRSGQTRMACILEARTARQTRWVCYWAWRRFIVVSGRRVIRSERLLLNQHMERRSALDDGIADARAARLTAAGDYVARRAHLEIVRWMFSRWMAVRRARFLARAAARLADATTRGHLRTAYHNLARYVAHCRRMVSATMHARLLEENTSYERVFQTAASHVMTVAQVDSEIVRLSSGVDAHKRDAAEAEAAAAAAEAKRALLETECMARVYAQRLKATALDVRGEDMALLERVRVQCRSEGVDGVYAAALGRLRDAVCEGAAATSDGGVPVWPAGRPVREWDAAVCSIAAEAVKVLVVARDVNDAASMLPGTDATAHHTPEALANMRVMVDVIAEARRQEGSALSPWVPPSLDPDVLGIPSPLVSITSPPVSPPDPFWRAAPPLLPTEMTPEHTSVTPDTDPQVISPMLPGATIDEPLVAPPKPHRQYPTPHPVAMRDPVPIPEATLSKSQKGAAALPCGVPAAAKARVRPKLKPKIPTQDTPALPDICIPAASDGDTPAPPPPNLMLQPHPRYAPGHPGLKSCLQPPRPSSRPNDVSQQWGRQGRRDLLCDGLLAIVPGTRSERLDHPSPAPPPPPPPPSSVCVLSEATTPRDCSLLQTALSQNLSGNFAGESFVIDAGPKVVKSVSFEVPLPSPRSEERKERPEKVDRSASPPRPHRRQRASSASPPRTLQRTARPPVAMERAQSPPQGMGGHALQRNASLSPKASRNDSDIASQPRTLTRSATYSPSLVYSTRPRAVSRTASPSPTYGQRVVEVFNRGSRRTDVGGGGERLAERAAARAERLASTQADARQTLVRSATYCPQRLQRSESLTMRDVASSTLPPCLVRADGPGGRVRMASGSPIPLRYLMTSPRSSGGRPRGSLGSPPGTVGPAAGRKKKRVGKPGAQ